MRRRLGQIILLEMTVEWLHIFEQRATSTHASHRRGSCGASVLLGPSSTGAAAGSTGRLDDGDLLVCERPVDGFSWSPPSRALQADALRELTAVHDVVLKTSFPELLPAGPTANSSQQTGRWLPARPASLRLQLLLRGRARRHEALHREARPWGKTLV